jgi:hypothetical protein
LRRAIMQDLKAKREIFLLFLWMERENSDPLRNNGGLCLVVLCVVCRESCSRVQIDAGGSTRGAREREGRVCYNERFYMIIYIFCSLSLAICK